MYFGIGKNAHSNASSFEMALSTINKYKVELEFTSAFMACLSAVSLVHTIGSVEQLNLTVTAKHSLIIFALYYYE